MASLISATIKPKRFPCPTASSDFSLLILSESLPPLSYNPFRRQPRGVPIGHFLAIHFAALNLILLPSSTSQAFLMVPRPLKRGSVKSATVTVRQYLGSIKHAQNF